MATTESIQNPRKRARTQDVPAEVTRSEPWMADGNVILETESTQFRVHQSILSSNSPIFKDMFVVGEDTGDAIDDCPVVHLPDSADDVRHVLTALYDRSYFQRDEQLPFSTIAAFVRLGKKYEIGHLYDDAMARLRSAYPSAHWQYGMRGIRPAFSVALDCQNPNDVHAVNLARELGIYDILPAAFYSIVCTLSTKQIFYGVPLENGDFLKLSVADQYICISGRERILDALPETSMGWMDEVPTEDCTSHELCKDSIYNARALIWAPPVNLELALSLKNSLQYFDGCPNCNRAANSMHDAGRKVMWTMLPSCFDLPTWDELIEE
ncbi:hypothetical protein PLICRDRAFT_105831 [Plicaturopsis crispa FD-325 SS-3]|nr:hypothetical protein PLICRDRAFT_105831 [Plicaturopsis crispa FD-325 SS-3]